MGSLPASLPARACALDDVIAHVAALDASAIGGLPGTAAMVLDRELRVLQMAGPAWAEVGIDPSTIVGRSLADSTPPETYAVVLPHYQAVLAGEERAFTLAMRRDRTHWLIARPIRDADGPVEGVLAVSWDQTSVSRAEDKYRLLAENATDVVTRHDLQGRYVYVSPSVVPVIGWAPEDMLGRSCFELIHPDDVEMVTRELVAASAERVVTIDYRIRHRDGSYVWVESSCRWVVDPEGEVAEIQCSTRDITARRKAERELAQRLAQQSAVARLGELALQRGDIAALQQAACELVSETLGVDLAYLLEHLGDAQMLVRASVGFPEGFTSSEFEVATFRSDVLGEFYADGAVAVDDLRTHPMRAAPLRAQGVASCAHVLVGERGRPLGLLGAHSRAARRFSQQDLDFLQAVAHVIAGALERLRAEERIRHDALHDALTGLPNRTLLLDRLRVALARGRRDRSHVAVLFLDLDHLKVVNDSLGHDAGDDLLRAVGPRLAEVVRPSDTVARFGGDEFAVLLEGVTGETGAIAVAERIVSAFAAPFTVAGEPRFGSASVGLVVTGPDGPRTPEELLSDADAAMYRAKERGRGRYEIFDAGLRDRITARLRMEGDLRRALEGEGRLWVAYQPFWHIPERRIAGVEALVRWDHPERGAIPPSEFIPVAEESGLIVDLGTRVLRAACSQVARWQAETPFADLQLTVNVSARQVAGPDLVATVAGVLAETGLPSRALGLEITEGLLLEETPATGQTIRALQALGARLILDDFGTGYSSLRYLQRYPLDGLKVDQSFVSGLGPDGDGDVAIVEAIVGMARALGMRIIPEGVETDGQLRRLAALGLRYAQGYLLSRPLTAEGLHGLLRAESRAVGHLA